MPLDGPASDADVRDDALANLEGVVLDLGADLGERADELVAWARCQLNLVQWT